MSNKKMTNVCYELFIENNINRLFIIFKTFLFSSSYYNLCKSCMSNFIGEKKPEI